MTGLELIALATPFVVSAIATPIMQYKQKMDQADAIRAQAQMERGDTEKNIGLRMARARRMAATSRARAGASGVNPLVGSAMMSELGIIGMENQQAEVLRQNAMARMRLANEAASDIELGANIGLGFGLVHGLGQIGLMAYALGGATTQAGFSGGNPLATGQELGIGVNDLIGTGGITVA